MYQVMLTLQEVAIMELQRLSVAEPKHKAESLCLMSFRTLVGWYSSLISVAVIQYFDKKNWWRKG